MKHKSGEHHGMIDNRMVKDSHQEGISRVLQRGHSKSDYKGHNGYMGGGWKHSGSHEHASFKRNDGSLTPRKA